MRSSHNCLGEIEKVWSALRRPALLPRRNLITSICDIGRRRRKKYADINDTLRTEIEAVAHVTSHIELNYRRIY